MTDTNIKARRKWAEALMPGDAFVNPADGLSYTVQSTRPAWVDRPNRAPIRMIDVVTGPGSFSRFEPGTIVEMAQ